MTASNSTPRRFGLRALAAFLTVPLVTLFVAAGDPTLPTEVDVAAQKAKFQAEREQLVKSGAAKLFQPSLLEQADLMAKRAESALQTKRFMQATEGYRQARWQLPYAPATLPDHLVRVFGNQRLRHTHEVRAVAYSPNGLFLASAGLDRTVRIWDLDNGHEVLKYQGHNDLVAAVAYSPDGKLIASCAGGEKNVRIWDAKTGQDVLLLKGGERYYYTLAFSRDGKYLVAGGDDKCIRIWQVVDGKLVRTITDFNVAVRSVAFSHDGSKLAAGVDDGQIQLYEYPKIVENPNQPLYWSKQDALATLFVTFSPDGKTLARCGPDGVKLYNVQQPGSTVPVSEPRLYIKPVDTGAKPNIKDFSNWYDCVAFSKNSQVMFTGGSDGVVRLWDPELGHSLGTFRGHNDKIRALVFNASGTQLASASDDYTLRLWQFDLVVQSREFADHKGPAWTAAFHPDGQRVVSASADHTVKMWDFATGKVQKTIAAHSGPVTLATYSPDGKLVLSGGADKLLKLWNAETGELVRTLEGHKGTITTAAFNSDGSMIASAAADRSLKVWTTATGKPVVEIADAKSIVAGIAFHPNDKQFVTGSIDQRLRLWSLAGKEEQAWIAHSAAIGGLAFSPNGEFLATCGGDQLVRVWRVSNLGSNPMILSGHSGPVSSVTFRPDGKILASAGQDMVVRLWRYEGDTFKEAQKFHGHRDWISSVAFSKDGFYIASAAVDKTVRLWEITSRDLPLLAEHTGAVEAVAVSSDGKWLATGATDRTVKIWDLQTGVERLTITGHPQPVQSLAFTPGGNVLVGSADRAVHLWDPVAGKELPRTATQDESFRGHISTPALVHLSADGKRLCLWIKGNERFAQVATYDMPSGEAHWQFNDTGRNVKSAAFSRDGKKVLLGAADGTVKGYDLDRKAGLVEKDLWKIGEKGVTALAFANDGDQFFIMGGEDGLVALCNLTQRDPTFSVKGHAAPVYAIAVSADGKRFATVATDNVLKVWDRASGKELRQWTLRGGAVDRPLVTQLAFTPDGRALVTANTNTSLYMLELP